MPRPFCLGFRWRHAYCLCVDRDSPRVRGQSRHATSQRGGGSLVYPWPHEPEGVANAGKPHPPSTNIAHAQPGETRRVAASNSRRSAYGFRPRVESRRSSTLGRIPSRLERLHPRAGGRGGRLMCRWWTGATWLEPCWPPRGSGHDNRVRRSAAPLAGSRRVPRTLCGTRFLRTLPRRRGSSHRTTAPYRTDHRSRPQCGIRNRPRDSATPRPSRSAPRVVRRALLGCRRHCGVGLRRTTPNGRHLSHWARLTSTAKPPAISGRGPLRCVDRREPEPSGRSAQPSPSRNPSKRTSRMAPFRG